MSYDAFDWFDDNFKDKLKSIKNLDDFINSLKLALNQNNNGAEKFKCILMNAILDDDSHSELYDKMKECFDILTMWNECSLKKMEYEESSVNIKIDFEGGQNVSD